MPTRTQQSDIVTCAYASHGDTKHVLLLPADPGECFEFAALSFDLADRLQTPIFVMLDLDIGMNEWLSAPLRSGTTTGAWTAARSWTSTISRPAASSAAISTSTTTASPTAPIPAPIRPRGAFFTRGSSEDRLRALHRGGRCLRREHAAAAEEVPRPPATCCRAPVHGRTRKSAHFGVIYYGSTAPAMEEALDALEDHGASARHHAPARLPLPRRGRRLHRPLRQGVRGRAEPRRPDAHAAGQRVRRRSGQAHSHPPLRRHAHHRPLHHPRDRAAGWPRSTSDRSARLSHDLHHQSRPSITPKLPTNSLGYTRRDYEGAVSTLCAGCGHDSDQRRHHPGLLRAGDPAAPRRQALGHRLLLEDAELFPRQLARLQHACTAACRRC